MDRPVHLVVMGVSGCGKSVVGERIAQRFGLPLIEGDRFHPQANIDKMARGEPLDDEDRAGWLGILGAQLQAHAGGAVLACSALKKKYRDTLRSGVAEPAFVHLSITPEESQRRVSARSDHFYPASLVSSQFEALEEPAREPRVLIVDGSAPIDEIVDQAVRWLSANPSA